MNVPVTLSMTGEQHDRLKQFLFPGDGKEAVAILLCGRCDGDRRHRLLVRAVELVPYNVCTERTAQRVSWPPEFIEPLLERATAERLSVVKVHSHPPGYAAFSNTDDEGDARLLPLIRGWVEANIPHGSAVMLPDGQMFGRYLRSDNSFAPLDMISVVGDDLHFWYADAGSIALPSFAASHAQIFDDGTIERLRRLSFALIGGSGTGSPTFEQLIRLGAALIVVVDDDHMEDRNVNRILNSTIDAKDAKMKVDVLGDAAERTGLGTRVIRVPKNLWDPEGHPHRRAMRCRLRLYGHHRRPLPAQYAGDLLHAAVFRYRRPPRSRTVTGRPKDAFERSAERSITSSLGNPA